MKSLSEKHHRIGTEWDSTPRKDEKTEDREGKVTHWFYTYLWVCQGWRPNLPGPKRILYLTSPHRESREQRYLPRPVCGEVRDRVN